MSTKEQIIFTDADKLRRAEDVYLILLSKRPKENGMSEEHRTHLLSRFTELLEEGKLDVKKSEKEEVLEFIYRKLGGGIRTHAQQERIEKAVESNKIGGSKSHDAMETKDDEDDDDKDDE